VLQPKQSNSNSKNIHLAGQTQKKWRGQGKELAALAEQPEEQLRCSLERYD